MSAKGGIKLSKEWRQFLDTMDPKQTKTRMAKAAMIAGARVGQRFQRDARRLIRGKKYAANSPVTVILKGSSTPLVAGGDLFQGLTYAQPDPYTVHLGVMRRKVGDAKINVALILHEGATINVGANPKVRRKVMAMMRDRLGPSRLSALTPRSRRATKRAARTMGLSPRQRGAAFAHMGRGRARGGTGSGVWIIPARPFIARPIEDPAFGKFVLEQYAQATRAVFGGR